MHVLTAILMKEFWSASTIVYFSPSNLEVLKKRLHLCSSAGSVHLTGLSTVSTCIRRGSQSSTDQLSANLGSSLNARLES